MKKIVGTLLVSTFLTGCIGGANIKSVDAYSKRPLVKASIMPTTDQLKGAKTRVVVLDISNNNIGVAKKASLGTAIRGKVESMLSDAGVELIDRSLAAKLQKEITLAEVKGKSKVNYKGPKVADYTVSGNVVAANYTQRYSASSTWYDKKGRRHYSPPSCSYSVQFEGVLKIHELPSLRLVDTIKITDTESKSQTLRRYASRCHRYNQSQLNGLAIGAGVDAVYESKVQLQNNFSPRGYVSEYRVKGDEHIFRITMGKLAGVKEGQVVNVIKLVADTDGLTNETTIEDKIHTEAEVSNQIGKKYSWIAVDDAAKAKQIRLGDVVKVKFEDSLMDNLKKIF